MTRLIGKSKQVLKTAGSLNWGGALSHNDLLDLFESAVTAGGVTGVWNMQEVYEEIQASDWINDQKATTARAQPSSDSTITLNSVALDRYDYTYVAGNQTVSSFSNSDYFTTNADRYSALVYIDGDLTINSGQTFRPSNRKTFTAIYVAGNLTVNGSISMQARGADHNGLVSSSNIRLIAPGTYSGVPDPKVSSSGGSGGAESAVGQAGNDQAGATGGAGTGGGLGGGGGGAGTVGGNNPGAYSGRARGGAGKAGTSFSGGPGGGGASTLTTPSSQIAEGGDGQDNGGTGGDGCPAPSNSHYHAHGGTGNPGGTGVTFNGSPLVSSDGTGGTLIIFVAGNYSGSGTVESNGSVGFGCAGASGGGHVSIFVKGTDGGPTPTASGGNSGQTSPAPNPNGQIDAPGGDGGAGTARKMAYS